MSIATQAQTQHFACGHELHSAVGDELLSSCPTCYPHPSRRGWRWPTAKKVKVVECVCRTPSLCQAEKACRTGPHSVAECIESIYGPPGGK